MLPKERDGVNVINSSINRHFSTLFDSFKYVVGKCKKTRLRKEDD